MESWEPTEKNIEAIDEKAWQLTQSSNTKGQKLEQDWDTLLSLANENGRTKDKKDMAKVWKEKKESA